MISFISVNVLFVYLITQVIAQSNYTCYFPNGNETPFQLFWPCPNSRDSNGQGSCCWAKDYCTPNGFCISSVNSIFYRGACTDQTWSSIACPQGVGMCAPEEYAGSTPALTPCGEQSFVCGYSATLVSSCANTSIIFKIEQLTPMLLQLLPDADGQCNFTADNTNCVPTSQFSITGSPSSVYVSSFIPITANPSRPTANSTMPSSVNSTLHCLSKSSQNVALGVGLGIPLGISALGWVVLSMLFLQKKATKYSAIAPANNHSNERPLQPEAGPHEIGSTHGGLGLSSQEIHEAPTS